MATRGLLKVQLDTLREYEQLINSYMFTNMHICQLIRDSIILSKP